MKLAPIIEALRAKCPSFESRVFGVAMWAQAEAEINSNLPCAYVVPLSVDGGESYLSTKFRQTIRSHFGVAVVIGLSADDAAGNLGHDQIDDLRSEVFRAILGAQVGKNVWIEFDGQTVTDLNRARLVETLEFSVEDDITGEETAQGQMIADLPDFDHLYATVAETGTKTAFHLNEE